jgi:hypothetical protein
MCMLQRWNDTAGETEVLGGKKCTVWLVDE